LIIWIFFSFVLHAICTCWLQNISFGGRLEVLSVDVGGKNQFENFGLCHFSPSSFFVHSGIQHVSF
jgi:hypothetical protein